MSELTAARRRFAQAILRQERISSPRLLRAFSVIPRERFLDAGPWRLRNIVPAYWSTLDADPVHLYNDVLVAIDEDRGLDNGLPSLWARMFDLLDIRENDRVVQIGCGTGYYSAILSEIVGSGGAVVAIDCDKALVRKARRNLRAYGNVAVVYGDGRETLCAPADAIVVHAGFAQVHPAWLDALRSRGRLLVPITNRDRRGTAFKVTRAGAGYRAEAVGPIRIMPSHGRSDEPEVKRRLRWWEATSQVRSLRRDAHARDHTCWLHVEGSCLSSRSVHGSAARRTRA
jgi:protein-L-isoaspartate(D-aspartate) O-methyltransferase